MKNNKYFHPLCDDSSPFLCFQAAKNAKSPDTRRDSLQIHIGSRSISSFVFGHHIQK